VFRKSYSDAKNVIVQWTTNDSQREWRKRLYREMCFFLRRNAPEMCLAAGNSLQRKVPRRVNEQWPPRGDMKGKEGEKGREKGWEGKDEILRALIVIRNVIWWLVV